MTWTDWPARRRPLAAGFAVLVVGVFALALSDSPLLAVLAAALLLGATAEVLLPTRYTLDDDGVHARNPLSVRHRPWSDLESWTLAPEGAWLLGRGSRAFLRRRRSLRLRGAPDPDALHARLTERLGAPTGAS